MENNTNNQNITLDALKGIPVENVPNPNLRKKKPNMTSHKPTGQVKEVDPSKILGLKSKAQAYRESNESAPPEEKVFGTIDKAIERKVEEVKKAQDLYDQNEGEVTKEDLNDIIGFDPDELLKNPPRPGKEHTRVKTPVNAQNKPVNNKINVPKKEVIIHGTPDSEESVDETDENIIDINDLKTNNTGENISYDNDILDPTEEEIMQDIENEIPEEYDEVEEDVIQEKVEDQDYEIEEDDYEDELEEEEQVEEEETPIKPVTVEKNAEDVDEPINKSDVLPPIPENKPFIDRSEDDDLKALDEESSTETEEEAQALNEHRIELLKKDVRKKVTPIFAKNIAGFSIAKKPISISNTSAQAKKQHGRVADWVLPASNRIISMRELTGPEIDTVLSNANTRNKLNSIREQYQLLYDHVEDPYKPGDVESWAKLISVSDVDHLYAAVYRASFEGVNFIPYDCPDTKKCKNSFLSDNVPFMDMVKFKDSHAKAHFDKLINSVPTEKYSVYNTEVYPVSDVYALGFKEPSIYDVVFVSAYLDDAFIQKYQDIMAIAPYVDGMYYIDQNDKVLRPIYVKEYPNDVVKTAKAKIITLSKIIKDLSSDQFNMIAMYANDVMGDRTDEITFRIPETHCPKCGAKIEEAGYTASQLLFLRHHLTALANG